MFNRVLSTLEIFEKIIYLHNDIKIMKIKYFETHFSDQTYKNNIQKDEKFCA